MSDLYQSVPGQPAATRALRAAAFSPLHAYLLVGPPGSGKKAAAVAFAASLICPRGGCGSCRDCTRVMSERHPDLIVKERTGPFITVDDARDIARLAMRSPAEGARQVLVLVDFHLAERAAPALLKTIEEPPASTYFVVLAEHVRADLAPLSRACARG